MDNRTLEIHKGKLVQVIGAYETGVAFGYFGKLSDYDDDFLTLNPSLFQSKHGNQDEQITKLNELDVGKGTPVTINKRRIATIEEVLVRK